MLKSKIKPPRLIAYISPNLWSYIVNGNGNAIRMTLEGHGSCTPIYILQKWIRNMTPIELKKWSKRCDVEKDKKD